MQDAATNRIFFACQLRNALTCDFLTANMRECCSDYSAFEWHVRQPFTGEGNMKMGAKRLENAAQAAGFAMVNPDDFAGDAAPVLQARTQPAAKTPPQTSIKSWLNWDYLRLTGGKATA
ncbi:MAG: hypothetical protein ACR2PI_23640 [Hyphomicrobiaceae bacterium]